ncbi:unnamed protein product [Closterium sp. Yama58-4]|nr:unnamed protein product [Closterium sp. Yama58-4]
MSLVEPSCGDVVAPRHPHSSRSAHGARPEARHARSLSHQMIAPVAHSVAGVADSSQPRSDSESSPGESTQPHHPPHLSQLWQRRSWQPAASLQIDPRRQSSAGYAAFGAARHSRSASAAGLLSVDCGGDRPDRGASPYRAAVRPAGSARERPGDCGTVGASHGHNAGARQTLARSHSVSGGATSTSKGAVATGAAVAHADGTSQGHRDAVARLVRGASASPPGRAAAVAATTGVRKAAGGSSESTAWGTGGAGGTVTAGSSAAGAGTSGTEASAGSIGTHARAFRRSASCAFRAGGEAAGDGGERALRRGQSQVVRGSSTGDGGTLDAAAASPASHRRAGGAAFQRVFSTSSLEEPFPAGAALSPPRASPTWPSAAHARRHSTCADFRALSPAARPLPRKTAGTGSNAASSSAAAAKAGDAPVAPAAPVAVTSAPVPAPAPSAESPPAGGTASAGFPRGVAAGRAATRRSASLASLAEWQQTMATEASTVPMAAVMARRA